VFYWNNRDDIIAYYTQSELEASLIECSLLWSKSESRSEEGRKDGRQETPFYCRYCAMEMHNRNRLGEYLDSGECPHMDRPMKLFRVFTSANVQHVPIAAFQKHLI
jgi:hypothetical protein